MKLVKLRLLDLSLTWVPLHGVPLESSRWGRKARLQEKASPDSHF